MQFGTLVWPLCEKVDVTSLTGFASWQGEVLRLHEVPGSGRDVARDAVHLRVLRGLPGPVVRPHLVTVLAAELVALGGLGGRERSHPSDDDDRHTDHEEFAPPPLPQPSGTRHRTLPDLPVKSAAA